MLLKEGIFHKHGHKGIIDRQDTLNTTSMKSKILGLMGLVALCTGATVYGQVPALSGQGLPFRLNEPDSSIIGDLTNYIPDFMRREHIPGVAVALIRDGEIVWTEGFGVKSTLTAEPVTSETIFEVASNSKVVTAYLALRLVDQGRLSLDEPLNTYLREPWLPPSESRNTITLRHVLSHSSGLGHSTTSRENLFAPGRGYSYSAVGFQYLQAVIEQVTGQSLEQVAQELAFAPLGMSSSSFVNRKDLTSRTANGHLRAVVPVLLFAILYAISLIIVGLIGLVILRFRTGTWRPAGRGAMGALAVAFFLSLLPAFILLGLSGLLEFAWLIALCGLVVAIVVMLTFIAGRLLIRRLFPGRWWLQATSSIVWSLLILIGFVLLASRITNVPVPRWPATSAQAAGSMRATVGDMAAFLIELSDPQHLSPEMAAALRESQVSLSTDLSWGLGPGIQHSRQGDALWQWGQHIDFQSLSMIYPAHGFGVVVCTNSDLFNPDVALDIAHRALGGVIDPVRRATHLEFNYREGR